MASGCPGEGDLWIHLPFSLFLPLTPLGGTFCTYILVLKTDREGGCMIEQESCFPDKSFSSFGLYTCVCSRLRHGSIRGSCSDL